MATATKDMWVASLVEPWKGDSKSVPVTEFFESITEAKVPKEKTTMGFGENVHSETNSAGYSRRKTQCN